MTTTSMPWVSQRITVEHVRDDEFAIRLRAHELHTDQPQSDRAMSPVELLVASLATCVAHYANVYLRRHSLPVEGLRVHADYMMATDRPARISRIRVTAEVAQGLPPQQKQALQAVVNHCTVHNTLRHPPEVEIRIEEESREH
ncbi:OsmC family protein [Lentzea sp.]|uniref:OsmC family protein n=1 Tax=Lentzea sp. TaxID=56099 RepID=UPI002ED174A6